jgi:hypothetical protein
MRGAARYRGVIHVHSEASHDGRDSLATIARALAAEGLDFCILTDHLQGLDPPALERLLDRLAGPGFPPGFVFVPGVEAEFCGVHLLLVPATDPDRIRRALASGDLGRCGALKLLAHPSQHPVEQVADLLREHPLDGVELWNQLSDSRHGPPLAYLRSLLPRMPAGLRGHFFGADSHSVRHGVSNTLSIPADGPLSASLVVEALRRRSHVSVNRQTGIALPGRLSAAELPAWLEGLPPPHTPRALLAAGAAPLLRSGYRLLPRPLRQRLARLRLSVKSRL